jgi:hypothetical protein
MKVIPEGRLTHWFRYGIYVLLNHTLLWNSCWITYKYQKQTNRKCLGQSKINSVKFDFEQFSGFSELPCMYKLKTTQWLLVLVSEMKSDLLLFSNRVYVKLPLAMEINIDFSMDTKNQLFLLDSHKFGFKWSS